MISRRMMRVFGAVEMVVIFRLVVELRSANDMKRKIEYEKSLHEKYDDSYKELVTSIRKRQHDFDNHLQAITSMAICAKDLDELVNEQSVYCMELTKDNREMMFLDGEAHSVKKAFLYTKIRMLCEKGIQVDYHFQFSENDLNMELRDFVVLVGNLLDNAEEAVCNNDESGDMPKIVIEIMSGSQGMKFRFGNAYPFMEGELAENLFRKKSIKGKGHGLGTKNIQDILNKYQGICDYSFAIYEGQRFVWIEMLMPVKNKMYFLQKKA